MAIPSVQQANLNSTRYCRLEVPVPPLNEQMEIGKLLEQKSSEITKLEEKINAQVATLTAYRKSLIHEYVTGKLRIREMDLARVGEHV